MTQIERICHMEGILDKAEEAVKDLSLALERYLAIKDELDELEAYYTGPQWMQDYEADCAGELPKDLKRGVLSEDAVYNLLSDRDALRELAEQL